MTSEHTRELPDTVENAAATPGQDMPWKELGLKEDEYQRICDILGRRPTNAELAMYSVMWSEHCSYKSSKKHLAEQFGARTTDAMRKNLLVGMGQNAGVVDIGGGSTELTRIESSLDFDNASIGQGSLSSFAQHVRAILPTPGEMDAIAEAFRKRFAGLPNSDAYRSEALYGIGGSVRAAAKMHAQATGAAVRPKTMTKQQIHAILAWCRTDPDTFAHAALKASAERVHTLVPGCIILGELFDACGAERLDVCKYGVREGYLIDRMLR